MRRAAQPPDCLLISIATRSDEESLPNFRSNARKIRGRQQISHHDAPTRGSFDKPLAGSSTPSDRSAGKPMTRVHKSAI